MARKKRKKSWAQKVRKMEENLARVEKGNEYLPKDSVVEVLREKNGIAYVKHAGRVFQIGVKALARDIVKEEITSTGGE